MAGGDRLLDLGWEEEECHSLLGDDGGQLVLGDLLHDEGLKPRPAGFRFSHSKRWWRSCHRLSLEGKLSGWPLLPFLPQSAL